jgi:endonuclease I
MKSTLTFICTAILTICTSLANAQAVLPTSWNFDVNAPAGWSESLGASNTRYANGLTGQACRLDLTGDFILLEFAEEPGVLSYNLKGQNSGGAFQGTFTIQESADGVNFTTLRSLAGGALPATAFTLFSDNPAANTRYIRWFFTEKISGHNVALDDISLNAPTAGTAQEINVTDGTNNIPSGFTVFMGNATSETLTIQNQGSSANLIISNISITGANASEFSIASIPDSIEADTSAILLINFTPTFNGSHFCTVTISSNDSSEPEYVVNLYAISGGAATEPTAQPTAVSITNIRSWDFQTSIAAASTAVDGYIVLRKKGSPVTETPSDNTTYVRGQWIGGAQVVYVGEAGSFDARGIEAGFTYNLAAFSFNGQQGFENYLTNNPTVTTVNTPAPNFGSLYNSINLESPTLVSDLTALMNPSNYFQIYYSNYISTLINNFYVRDTVVNGTARNMVECQYSGVPFLFDAGFQWTTMSREHNFPQSWMPTYGGGTTFEESYEVSDLHNLSPVLQIEVNAVRSNYPYGDVVNATSTFQDCKRGTNSIGQTVYEMRDSFKGNAARAVMYHAAKNNTAANDFSLPEQISLTIQYGQNEYVLKQWHFQDLPDSWEITRNEYIQYEQHNRNAFIDQVTYPCYIRFADLTPFTPEFIYNSTTLTCIDPALSYQWYLDGNPIDGATSATYNFTTTGNYSVQIQQFSECPSFTSNSSLVTINVEENEAIQFDLSVFPNPSEGRVVVKTHASRPTAAQINVLDMSGKIVFTSNENLNGGLNLVAIEQELSAGVYTVEIRSGESAQTTRLVIR